eukprot:358595-Chlamydomonas_euryale.AAC.5
MLLACSTACQPVALLPPPGHACSTGGSYISLSHLVLARPGSSKEAALQCRLCIPSSLVKRRQRQGGQAAVLGATLAALGRRKEYG